MKSIFLTISLFLIVFATAQPRIVEKAIVKAKTEITFPENFSFGGGPGGGGPGGGGGGEGMSFSMPRDMENTMTMTYTPDYMKIENLSDFGNNVVITDRKNQKTTTLIEAMGRKTGFYTSTADAEAQRARQDSMRKARRDSLAELGITFRDNKPELIYTEETKKISGFTCKKVIVKTTGQNGQVTESIVWYTPEFKIAPGSMAPAATGGFPGGGGGGRGMSMMSGSIQGLELIDGFPVEYEVTRENGFKIHMMVLKVQLDPAVDEKTFEIPKGFDVKPMSSFESQGGMRMIFRNGGN
ncbi:MAG: hypothetical protein ACK43J_03785 [Chitinophagaceae bacterium]|jgi:hypothetical protein